jgi:excisionase family DNA binding protein
MVFSSELNEMSGFSAILVKLEALEKGNVALKNVFTLDDFCVYTGYSKSWAYKLTSGRKLPYFQPEGKAIYFRREDVEAFLLRNPIKSKNQLETTLKKG